MDGRIKAAFDQVHAGEELKERTLAYVKKQTRGYTRKKSGNLRYVAAAAACLLFLLVGGNWLYFSPTAQISIDINPSIELSVNRFDRVISVDGYNEDGETLAEELDVRFQNYYDVVAQVLEEESIADLLSNDAVMTITVVGDNEEQADRILSDMETCTMGQSNTYCYLAKSEEVSQAHELGLSYGKYRAYLEVSALDPSITPEQVQGMTMREIQDLIQALSDGQELPSGGAGAGNHGYGHGSGGGWSKGHGE